MTTVKDLAQHRTPMSPWRTYNHPRYFTLSLNPLCQTQVTGNPLQTTELEFLSHLRSLAVEDNEQIEEPGPSTSSVRRSTRVRRPTWKVRENELAAVLHQEPPLAAIDVTPQTSFPPSPPPPSHQPLRSILNRFGLSRFYPNTPSTIPDVAQVTFEEEMTPVPAPTPPKH